MTSRKNSNFYPQKTADILVEKRSSFVQKLSEQIDIGEKLLYGDVTSQDTKNLNLEYKNWIDYNSEYLKNAFNNEKSDYWIKYNIAGRERARFGFGNDPREEFRELRHDLEQKVAYLKSLVNKADLLKSETSESNDSLASIKNGPISTKIFVVHGHNDEIKTKVARTIEKLGLAPVILHELPNGGKTIIEKFEAHSEEVEFAVILLTDDDKGNSKTENSLNQRARQNVILELGYFIGRLGRSRVLALHSNGVELPSDINGILYTPLDSGEAWKYSLAKELRNAGYPADANKL
jgi:predicted nucleotide-binding protein